MSMYVHQEDIVHDHAIITSCILFWVAIKVYYFDMNVLHTVQPIIQTVYYVCCRKEHFWQLAR